MVSLWGTSNRSDDEDGNSSSRIGDQDQRHHPEYDGEDHSQPSEHTRLLPNRLESTNYLSPDNPAVTPYNLWSVRVTRYLTVFLALATFGWWILQLVSCFITIPGLHTRGSGFFAFAYASITLLTLGLTLVFFVVPAKSVRVLSVIMAALLLIQTIMILAVGKVRHEEAWIGVAGVIWTFVIAVWVLTTDRLVLWGKTEEEERLTGRAETRRSVGEWTAVLVSTILMSVLTVVLLLMTINLMLRSLDAGLAPPGQMYWVDDAKYMLHVYCTGDQAGDKGPDGYSDADRHAGRNKTKTLPTVLLEGGEGPVEDGLWQFADAALKNGTIGRYCFVDRPGLAWSDTAPSPLSAGMAAEAITEALVRAGEDGPWVLVGAGIGALYTRVFSAHHPAQISGMLLIDPLHEDYLNDISAPGRGFGLWLRGVLSPLGLDRIPGAIFRGRTSADRVYGRAAYQSGKTIFAKLQENLVAASLSRRDVATSKAIQDKETRLVVVSSGEKLRDYDGWKERQRDLTRLTDRLVAWDKVDRAPHEVWLTWEGREVLEERLGQLVRG